MAQVDYFLLVDGIKGESQDKKHKDEIDIESWSWGCVQTGTHETGGGGGAGKVAFNDATCTKKYDKSSPMLWKACATGQHIKKAVLTCRKAGKEQQEYLKVIMEDLLVSSYQTGGSSGDIVPTESISFNFTKVEFIYKEQKPDGSLGAEVKAGYDRKAQVAK
jgi:type VI secretion system secreted protein Hcp